MKVINEVQIEVQYYCTELIIVTHDTHFCLHSLMCGCKHIKTEHQIMQFGVHLFLYVNFATEVNSCALRRKCKQFNIF
jgi:hypothetical protein